MEIEALTRVNTAITVGANEPSQVASSVKQATESAKAAASVDNKNQAETMPPPSLSDLEDAALVLEDTVRAFNQRLSFVLHEDSGRMQVQVIDNVTREVVRELPPTEVLDTVARIRQAVGLLLDKKV